MTAHKTISTDEKTVETNGAISMLITDNIGRVKKRAIVINVWMLGVAHSTSPYAALNAIARIGMARHKRAMRTAKNHFALFAIFLISVFRTNRPSTADSKARIQTGALPPLDAPACSPGFVLMALRGVNTPKRPSSFLSA